MTVPPRSPGPSHVRPRAPDPDQAELAAVSPRPVLGSGPGRAASAVSTWELATRGWATLLQARRVAGGVGPATAGTGRSHCVRRIHVPASHDRTHCGIGQPAARSNRLTARRLTPVTGILAALASMALVLVVVSPTAQASTPSLPGGHSSPTESTSLSAGGRAQSTGCPSPEGCLPGYFHLGARFPRPVPPRATRRCRCSPSCSNTVRRRCRTMARLASRTSRATSTPGRAIGMFAGWLESAQREKWPPPAPTEVVRNGLSGRFGWSEQIEVVQTEPHKQRGESHGRCGRG